MPRFPSGTVTFLFTDIERSTSLWERDAITARTMVERHLELLRIAIEENAGVLYKRIGDGTQSAFTTAVDGVTAALRAQSRLREEPWPSDATRPRVRMALHAGEATPSEGDYLAGSLNRLARLLDAAHGEQILLSHSVASLVRESLPEGATLMSLGEYQLRDILQPEEIFQLRHPELRSDFPPLRTPGYLPHNLPTHPTPFLGRERDVDELMALLQRPGVRLVTLTGPGGVGKTRLALQVAAEALESFPDGAFVVDLARQTAPELVPAATAAALGLREQPGQTLMESIAVYLRDRSILLIFDNFEHLLPAATLVAELLVAASGLNVLVTSRARLGLQAEHEYRVQTLPVPDLAALPPLEDLGHYDAVALFVTRAQALRPGFTLTNQNARAVAEIICRLDGLPLAIELAAARIKLLSPEQLRDRLGRRLPTLTGGARDLPARQQTMRATIAWSHDLLAPPERVLFRRLSVFVGGWTLEGAEAVSMVATAETVDALQSLALLIDQSLVDDRPRLGAAGDEPRYGMLEAIREFAAEQLAASGEAEQVERAFEEFLIALVEAAEQGLNGSDQLLWLERLEAEHDNLRAALTRSHERKDAATAFRFAPRLWEFWRVRGHPREGYDWLQRTLALAGPADISGRAAAEFGSGKLSIELGDWDAAERHYQASLDAHRQLGDRGAEAEVLSALAMTALNRLAFNDANQLGEEALELAREAGDRRGTAAALRILGVIAREQGEYDRALGLLEESMAIGRALADSAWTARIAFAIGITHHLGGNPEEARCFLDSSRVLFTELDDRYNLAVVASQSGHLAFDAGDLKRAVALYEEALRRFDSLGNPEGIIEAIEWLAVAAATEGEAAPALRLFGAATAAREALQLPRMDSDEQRVASGIRRAMRGAETGASATLAAGRTLSLEQARDEALELVKGMADALNGAQ